MSTSAFSTPAVGTLRAFLPNSLTQIYSGDIGYYAKFTIPIVADGNVYVATNEGNIVKFGLRYSTRILW